MARCGDVVSIVESVARGEFDCAAAVLSDEDQFLEAVQAATTGSATTGDARKVMLLDLGSALGVKAREHFYGVPDVLCLGLNPKRKIRPKGGAKAGTRCNRVLTLVLLIFLNFISEMNIMPKLKLTILPVWLHFLYPGQQVDPFSLSNP